MSLFTLKNFFFAVWLKSPHSDYMNNTAKFELEELPRQGFSWATFKNMSNLVFKPKKQGLKILIEKGNVTYTYI